MSSQSVRMCVYSRTAWAGLLWCSVSRALTDALSLASLPMCVPHCLYVASQEPVRERPHGECDVELGRRRPEQAPERPRRDNQAAPRHTLARHLHVIAAPDAHARAPSLDNARSASRSAVRAHGRAPPAVDDGDVQALARAGRSHEERWTPGERSLAHQSVPLAAPGAAREAPEHQSTCVLVRPHGALS